MNGAGGVGGHEFQVDGCFAQAVVVAEGLACIDDGGDDLSLGCCSQADVEEAGARDVSAGNRVLCAQCVGQSLGDLAGVFTDLLCHLQCHVGCVVAVLRVSRALNGYFLRQYGGIELLLSEVIHCDSADQL